MPDPDVSPTDQPPRPPPAEGRTMPLPEPSDWLADVWRRTKEHKVVQWTLAYAAFGYATVHGMHMAREAFEWPLTVTRVTLLLVLAGLPVAITLAWYHGHRGRQTVSGTELSILTALLLIAGTLLWRFSGHEHGAATRAAAPPAGISSAQPPPHSVAVLPFVNMSGDRDQDYFSDGLSEELINALSLVDALQVAARTSSFAFKGKALDAPTIAQALHVRAILEGSVRRAGGTVRVTAQLIDATTGFHVWSRTYDRDLKDVLAVQSDIATAVAAQLQAKLLGDEGSRMSAGGTSNPDAYDAYLRGTQLYRRARTEADYRSALAAFDESAAIDAGFSAAHTGRASALLGIGNRTLDLETRGRVLAEARAAAERAVELAPESGEAHRAAGLACQRNLELTCAERELNRAHALAPGDARVQSTFAFLAAQLGHVEAALTAARQAVRLDPQNFESYRELGDVANLSRRFDESIRAYGDAKALNAEYGREQFLAFSYLGLGEPQRALAICQHPAGSMADDTRHYCLAIVFNALGRLPEAQSELQALKSLGWGEARAVSFAMLYAQWGDKRAALDWLATAERTRAWPLANLKVEWLLDPVRGEPEFQALEKRLNFPP
jgi:serine/threonine-protein kinase